MPQLFNWIRVIQRLVSVSIEGKLIDALSFIGISIKLHVDSFEKILSQFGIHQICDESKAKPMKVKLTNRIFDVSAAANQSSLLPFQEAIRLAWIKLILSQ